MADGLLVARIPAEFDDFVLFNIYFPNGKRSAERLKYKMDFYAAFLEYSEKGILVLSRTSNPGASEFQDIAVGQGENQIPLYQHVALRARE